MHSNHNSITGPIISQRAQTNMTRNKIKLNHSRNFQHKNSVGGGSGGGGTLDDLRPMLKLSVDSFNNLNHNLNNSQEQIPHFGKKNSVSSAQNAFHLTRHEDQAGTLYFENESQSNNHHQHLPSIDNLFITDTKKRKR